jgi:hypothetical protein
LTAILFSDRVASLRGHYFIAIARIQKRINSAVRSRPSLPKSKLGHNFRVEMPNLTSTLMRKIRDLIIFRKNEPEKRKNRPALPSQHLNEHESADTTKAKALTTDHR